MIIFISGTDLDGVKVRKAELKDIPLSSETIQAADAICVVGNDDGKIFARVLKNRTGMLGTVEVENLEKLFSTLRRWAIFRPFGTDLKTGSSVSGAASEFDACRACAAPIRFLYQRQSATLISTKTNPIDAKAVSDGNVQIFDDRTYQILTGENLETARRDGTPLHKSHFATCPNAGEFRNKK